MDGRRFRWCLYGGLLAGTLGCHRNTYPETPGVPKGGPAGGLFGGKPPAHPGATPGMPMDPSALAPARKKGPLSPAAEVALAEVHIDAALADPAPTNRDELLDVARMRYQRALKQEPKNKAALIGVARMYARLGDRDKSAEAYKKYLDVYPKDADAFHEIALAQARWQDWAGAVTWCEAALKQDPDNRTYRKTLGFCQARAGKWDEALATLTKIMPEAQARHNLAGMLDHLGQPDACRAQLQMAVQANPNYAPAREFLAELDEGTKPREVGREPNPVEQAGYAAPR